MSVTHFKIKEKLISVLYLQVLFETTYKPVLTILHHQGFPSTIHTFQLRSVGNNTEAIICQNIMKQRW